MKNESKPKGRAVNPERNPGVYVGSIYGHKADMPLVELEIVGYPAPKVQMSVEQAREVVMHLLEAIEAAQTDAFMVRYFREKFDLAPGQIANLLSEFRAAREAMNRPANAGPEAETA